MATNKLKITVEFNITDVKLSIDQLDQQVSSIKNKIEEKINNAELAKFFYTLGIYHDVEVVNIKLNREYDTR